MRSAVSTGFVAVLLAVAAPVYAETKLSDFNGEWRGSGSDRNTPLEATQQTTCRMTIRADQRHMSSDTKCDGQAGLRKVLHLAVSLAGDQITGNASQTSTPRGQRSNVLNGAVAGQKTDNVASLHVSFPGLTPSATVLLTSTDPASFTMRINSLGLALTEVAFHRSKSGRR